MGKRLVKTVLPRYTNSQKDEKMVRASLSIRETQIKTTNICQPSRTLQKGHYQKNRKYQVLAKITEKSGPLHNVGRNIKWGSHYGKCFFIQRFLKTLKIALYLMQQSYFKRIQSSFSERDLHSAVHHSIHRRKRVEGR